MTEKGSEPVIALLGNPNSGKSSLFNYLTGLRQEVSNFPGVTVDIKRGHLKLSDGNQAMVVDFPGTYSLYPNSSDEKIVVKLLLHPSDAMFPDLVVYVADVTQLERHMLLATQIRDLGIPMIFVNNMVDLLEDNGDSLNTAKIQAYLGVPVIGVSVRNHIRLDQLHHLINKTLSDSTQPSSSLYTLSDSEAFVASRIQKRLGLTNQYMAKVIAHHSSWLTWLQPKEKQFITDVTERAAFNNLHLQVQETMDRYDRFTSVVRSAITHLGNGKATITDKLDRWITHRIIGPALFFLVMMFVFQSIFNWAEYPMELIEAFFAETSAFTTAHMPAGWFTDLLVNGLFAGLGGVLVFIPQIAILFFLISLLEESGYMSRVVFMFDSIMQRFGMNGRSMVSLISSGACAIPAIMATRTITNYRERLITILVSPLISCSARLPVYAVLVGFVVPEGYWMNVFDYRGLALMALYLLGIVGALFSAFVAKQLLRTDGPSFLMMELPNYQAPIWKNVFLVVREKVISFILSAGKIIVIISVVLWFLASYGPGSDISSAEGRALETAAKQQLGQEATDHLVASAKIEASYIGILGKAFEPAIAPLGFDWKIGIAILTSFAAREVFVGTMATIYSVGSESDEKTIREKMAAEIRPQTGKPLYDRATAASLLVFYVFAMQCMSTLAVTRKETGSWKWPLIQFVYMSLLAYAGAFAAFRLLVEA